MNRQDLYELWSSEFERLAIEVIKSQGYERIDQSSSAIDTGMDAIAEKKGQRYAVQVKHAKRLSFDQLKSTLGVIGDGEIGLAGYILITSASVSDADRAVLTGLASKEVDVRLIAGDEIAEFLAAREDLATETIEPARKRASRRKRDLWMGTIIAGIAVALGVWSENVRENSSQTDLSQRLEKVDSALESLGDLELELEGLKDEFIETEHAVQAIRNEHARAMELSKMSDEQFVAVKSALKVKTWRQTVLDYGLGFLLGIASSLSASALIARWKQKRATIA